MMAHMHGMPRLSRRAVFGISAAAATGASAHAAIDPDAELIALCREFQELDRRYCYLHNDAGLGDDEAEAATKPLLDRMTVILDPMCALRATTERGVRVRAATLLQYAPDKLRLFAKSSYFDDRLFTALLRDLMDFAA